MKRLRIEQDVQPVSAFRANAAKLIEQVQSHKRALVLTQRGRSAAVVLDPGEYDRLIELLNCCRMSTRRMLRSQRVRRCREES